jgi:Aminotransferase class-V
MSDMIYLDYQATTPLAPEAFAAMEPWLKDGFWNPHSAHTGGRRAAAAVAVARDQVAALLPNGGRVIFTSGATEAINLAIKGCGFPVAALATEHAAVLDCVEFLGGEVSAVRADGGIHHLPFRGEAARHSAGRRLVAAERGFSPQRNADLPTLPPKGERAYLRHAGQQRNWHHPAHR